MTGTKICHEGNDELIITALASGATQAEAGRSAGVSDRTVRRRLEDEAFVEQVRKTRTELISQAGGRAASLVGNAVAVFQELLGSDNETIRLRAAQAVIDTGRRLVTDSDIAGRLDHLERINAMDHQQEEAR